MKFLRILAFLAVAIAVPGLVLGELKSVAILFRHGERTVTITMPKYGDSALVRDLGLGQLTLTGSRQEYDNGVQLRSKYLSLLPKSGYFRTSNMRITSSMVERCIASLTSFMAGFFPPPNNDKTIPFRWQSFPFAVDNAGRILHVKLEACPTYLRDFTTAQDMIERDPMYLSWRAQDKDLLLRLGDFLGSPLTTFEEMLYGMDAIRTNLSLDPTLPAWVRNSMTQLEKYIGLAFDLYHKTDLMKKVRGGPMLTEMVDNMMAIKNKNTTVARNILIYSAHDLTVASLVEVLNVKSQVPVIAAYADTIAVEMHQTGNKEPEVKVFYVSNYGKTKLNKQLSVPNCGLPCTLNNFNRVVSKYLVRDWDGLCGL